MKGRYSLRVRVSLGMLALVSLASGAFAFMVHLASEQLEHNVLNQILERELSVFSERYRENPDVKPVGSATVRMYLADGNGELPAKLRSLEPGIYEDVDIGERVYHVLVGELGARRIYLTYDITAQEQREYHLFIVLVMAVMTVSIGAAGLGFWFSRTLIAPVIRLAERVRRLDPSERQVRLSSEFHGQEVEIITNAFDRYMNRLDSFVEREQSFVVTASHELRTPLTVIQGAAELLEGQQGLTPAGRGAVSRIRSATTEMAEFIRALLFLARKGEPGLEDGSGCELTKLIPAIVNEHRHMVSNKPVELSFTYENPLNVRGPASMVAIVIGNLLRNAMAHTDVGAVQVSLRNGTVSVHDTGKGIRPEDLEHVFDRHFSTKSDGGGIGLYIVRSICDRYGWKVTLQSTPGTGTTALLTF